MNNQEKIDWWGEDEENNYNSEHALRLCLMNPKREHLLHWLIITWTEQQIIYFRDKKLHMHWMQNNWVFMVKNEWVLNKSKSLIIKYIM